MSKTQNSESKEEQIMEKWSLIKEATELTRIFGSIVEKPPSPPSSPRWGEGKGEGKFQIFLVIV
jgi:hypothetical protein